MAGPGPLPERWRDYHWGRSWEESPLEDACPCRQHPCGLVSASTVDPECEQHGKIQRTRRQGHAADECPALTGPVAKLQAELTIARAEFKDFRDKLAALAAIEDYIAESGQNAARNIRDLLAGRGDDGNDPRVQARRWGLEWAERSRD